MGWGKAELQCLSGGECQGRESWVSESERRVILMRGSAFVEMLPMTELCVSCELKYALGMCWLSSEKIVGLGNRSAEAELSEVLMKVGCVVVVVEIRCHRY